MDQNQNFVLIGMPGAGKSTVGVVLAKTLKHPFLDTDLIIQTQTDRYLPDIIKSDGMETFLGLEARIVSSIEVTGHVIATGGSVVYRAETMAHLRNHGVVIFISLPFAVIERRVTDIGARGVVIAPGQSLAELYNERQPLYQQYADIVYPADDESVEAVVAGIVAALHADE